MTIIDDENAENFRELLGVFGTNANVDRRARAERRASLEPGDKRRKKKGDARDTQFNTRIKKSFSTAARAICKAEGWSQADLLEKAIAALAEARGIKVNA